MIETNEMIQELNVTRNWLPYIVPIRKKIEHVEAMDNLRAQAHNALFVGNTSERLNAVKGMNVSWRWIDRVKKIIRSSHDGKEAITKLTEYGLLKEIEQDDPILANMIRNIGLNPEELHLLVGLKGILEDKDRAKVIAALSEPGKFSYYERQLKLFGDDRLANELLNSLAYVQKVNRIGSAKITTLENFMRTIHNWRIDYEYLDNYVIGVRRFIDSLKNGSIDDKRLAKRIEGTNIIRHFLNYKELIKFLSQLLGMIHRGMSENNWDEFNAFYDRLKKEESKLHELGDDKTAKELKAEKRKVHQAPTLWEQKIGKMLWEKKQRKAIENVIKEASDELFNLLNERRIELRKYIYGRADAAIKELDNKISKRMKGVMAGKNIALRVIGLREKNLLKELNKTRKEFLKRENKLYPHAQVFHKIKEIFEEQDLPGIIKRTGALIKSKKKWLDYTYANLASMRSKKDMRNFVPLNSALFATSTLENLGYQASETDRRSFVVVESLPLLLQQINPALDEFIIRLREINGFLEKRGFILQQRPLPMASQRVLEQRPQGVITHG